MTADAPESHGYPVAPFDRQGAKANPLDHDICIIGAGPGGIQLGHKLLNAGRDYVIFERAATAGSFFARFPVHRKLISLNKRFTGRDDAEFNLRHDWNSLLDHPSIALMTNRSEDRWPHADVLVTYLRDFAKAQDAANTIRYNAAVQTVARHMHDAFLVTLASSGEAHVCAKVVVATGLVPRVPTNIDGIELAAGYEDLPETGRSFEGKAVLVLGMGNAAMETADALSPFTSYTHVIPGRPQKSAQGLSCVPVDTPQALRGSEAWTDACMAFVARANVQCCMHVRARACVRACVLTVRACVRATS